MPDREIGDLVARFRLIVEENGTKDASLAIDKLERKLAADSEESGSLAGSAFAGGFSGSLAGQAILTGVTDLITGAKASLSAFADAGKAGALDPAATASYIEFDNATTEATQAVHDLEVAIGEDLAPVVTEFSQLLTKTAPFIKSAFDTLLAPLTVASELMDKLTGSADENAGAAKRNAAAAAEEAKAQEGINRIIQEEEANFRKLINAQVDALEAQLKVESSDLSLTEARDAATKAQQAYNDIVNDSGAVAQKQADALAAVESAQRRLTDAQFAAHRAVESLADAQDALAEAQFQYGAQSDEAHQAAEKLEDAQHNLTDANASVDESSKSLADKQRDYKDALDASGPSSQAAKDAADKLAQAQLNVRQAELDSIEAHANWADKVQEAGGKTQTAADQAKTLEDNLRSMAAFAGSDEFASQLAAGAAAIGRLAAGSSLAGADGGRGFQSQLDAAIGAAPSGAGSISITVTAVGPTDELVAQLKEEFDQANRALFLGYGGQRP